jgi:hypothetical protein
MFDFIQTGLAELRRQTQGSDYEGHVPPIILMGMQMDSAPNILKICKTCCPTDKMTGQPQIF